MANYKVIHYKELVELSKEYADGANSHWYDPWQEVVVRLKDDGSLDYVCAFGGGEPEDNCYTRDHAWVITELNKVLNEKQ